jgi:hypothetical protein
MKSNQKVIVVLLIIGAALLAVGTATDSVPRSLWGLAFIVYAGANEIAAAIRDQE